MEEKVSINARVRNLENLASNIKKFLSSKNESTKNLNNHRVKSGASPIFSETKVELIIGKEESLNLEELQKIIQATRQIIDECKESGEFEDFYKGFTDEINLVVENVHTYGDKNGETYQGYTNDELRTLVDNNNYLIENTEIKDGFDFYGGRSLNDEIIANRKLNDIIDFINNSKFSGEPFSQFEKFLLAYQYVANRVYKNAGKPRWVPNIMTSDNIVCTGYANLLKYICDNIGIECQCQDLVVNHLKNGEVDKIEDHTNNVVYIKDDKYGIDGLFYCDACWDSPKQGAFAQSYDVAFFNYCCLSVDDIGNMLEKEIEFDMETEDASNSWGRNLANYHDFTNKHKKQMENPKCPTLQNFEDALCVVNGYTPEESKKFMNFNARRAKTLFKKDAKNCFATAPVVDEIVRTM